jgi:hypothetical protein
MFATISQDVQALRAMNLQNIDGRMTQAISALMKIHISIKKFITIVDPE